MINKIDRVKLFALNNLAIESAIRQTEKVQNLDLGHRHRRISVLDEKYYPQFPEDIRREAADMSANYRIFYCLENSIRSLVTDILLEKHGVDWWKLRVPDNVRNHVGVTKKKEAESGITIRSQEPIDYTTFGELGEIIRYNWADFSDTFQEIKALEKVLTTLNVLRGPIAHCKPLAEDEIVRLHLTVRDWFRSMG